MLAVALVHFPTVNKEGQTVVTSVTNFDIHDIARAACTYGVERYFIVTPIELQRQFTRRIVSHWLAGPGGEYNPSRKEALASVEIVGDLDEAGRKIQSDFGTPPLWIATSAKSYPNSITCDALRLRLGHGTENFCLIFGTGSGLHPEILLAADHILEPICGPTPFNHLSVRSAVSIYLDRLLAVRRG